MLKKKIQKNANVNHLIRKFKDAGAVLDNVACGFPDGNECAHMHTDDTDIYLIYHEKFFRFKEVRLFSKPGKKNPHFNKCGKMTFNKCYDAIDFIRKVN